MYFIHHTHEFMYKFVYRQYVMPLVGTNALSERKLWMVGIWYLINAPYLVMPGIGVLVAGVLHKVEI